MRIRIISVLVLVMGFAGVRTASAQANHDSPSPAFAGVTFVSTEPAATAVPTSLPVRMSFTLAVEPAAAVPQRPVAIEYSDAYRLRARIHKYASIATLPLFAAEGWAGQSLYTNPTQGKKSAHLAIATGIGALFAVNAVTGVWNLMDARKDPNGRTRRMIHGVLMLAASGGFFATAATAPESEFGERGGGDNGGGGDGGQGSRSLHRGIAFTSIGLATVSYLIMLFER